MDLRDQSKPLTLLRGVLPEGQHPHRPAYSPMFHTLIQLLQMCSVSALNIHLQITGLAKEAYQRRSLSYLRSYRQISCLSGISSVSIQSTQ